MRQGSQPGRQTDRQTNKKPNVPSVVAIWLADLAPAGVMSKRARPQTAAGSSVDDGDADAAGAENDHDEDQQQAPEGRPTRKSRGGPKNWIHVRAELAESLPPGPSTTIEMADWPLAAMRMLLVRGADTDFQFKSRIESLFSKGVCFYSDFSGMDTPREAIRLGLEAYKIMFGEHIPGPGVRFARACDKSAVPLQVLSRISQDLDSCSSCVFVDLIHRLPSEAQERIKASIPESDDDMDESKTEAFSDIAKYISDHAEWCFSPRATSHCIIHGKQCLANPLADVMYPVEGDGTTLEERAFQRPLAVSSQGVPCLPWTSEGTQLGDESPHELSHCVWLEERKRKAQQFLEDIFFVECTPKYPIHRKVVVPLQETHVVKWVLCGPERQGFPAKRMRMLGVGFNKKTMLYHGPESQEEVQGLFDDLFNRSIRMTGSSLMQASGEARDKDFIALAKIQGYHLQGWKASDLACFDKGELMRMLLPPGCVSRYKDWMASITDSSLLHVPQPGFADLMDEPEVLFDVDHNPGVGSTWGYDWPVVLKHGIIMSVKPSRPQEWTLATGTEHLNCLGWHMFRVEGSAFQPSPMAPILGDLPMRAQKALAGNGMHVATQFNWQWFCFSLAERVRPGFGKRPLQRIRKKGSWCVP